MARGPTVNLYLDTSALVKLFHDEHGSERVRELVQDAGAGEIWVSDLARIEFFSALQRRRRLNELDHDAVQEAVAGFEQELRRYAVEPMDSAIVDEACRLLLAYGHEFTL
ncbi:MAG: PIN domain-containing protein [Chitinivibrionales bacterium]|nr:PIN domain-containing protein [Chitinivibrionales bacterium]